MLFVPKKNIPPSESTFLVYSLETYLIFGKAYFSFPPKTQIDATSKGNATATACTIAIMITFLSLLSEGIIFTTIKIAIFVHNIKKLFSEDFCKAYNTELINFSQNCNMTPIKTIIVAI